MASSTNTSTTRIVTRDGIVTATVLDKVSPDRIALMLFRGDYAARYGSAEDKTAEVSRDIKDLLVFPFSQLS